MKHNRGKTKKEHNILEEFKKFLKELEQIEQIKRIIPGRINRKQKGSSQALVHFSYYTKAGMKYNMNKGSTSQELFLVCKGEDKDDVKQRVDSIKKEFNF